VQTEDVDRYLEVAGRWWWLLVLGVLVPAAISYHLASSQPDAFQSRTSLMVGGSIEVTSPNENTMNMANALAQAYAQLVRRRPILEPVIDTLGLAIGPDELAKQITAYVQPQLQLLEIEVIGPSPEWAAAVANALAAELIERSPSANQDTTLREFVEEQIADLRAKIAKVDGDIRDLEDSLATMTSAAEISETRDRIAAMQLVLTSYQGTLASLIQSLAREQNPNTLTVMEYAIEPSQPMSKRLALTTGVAGLVGLALSVGAIAIIEFLDERIYWAGPEQDELMGLPVLGAVARLPRHAIPLVMETLPDSPEAESVRHLSVSALLVGPSNDCCVLMLTSASPQEGKSTVAANMAIAMAELGLRTLVVDADLRKRELHQTFGMARGPGLAELLGDEGLDPTALAVPTHIPNLSILRAGGGLKDPSPLLASLRFRRVIESYGGRFDAIIIDSPAMLAVPDTAMMAAVAHVVVLLVDATLTRRRSAQSAKKRLQRQINDSSICIALNRVNLSQRGYYHYYHYYSGRNGRGAQATEMRLVKKPPR